MTKPRSHSSAFKRQVAEEFIAGDTLHALPQRHDIPRQLIRIWVGKFEAGALDEDVQAVDLIRDRRPGAAGWPAGAGARAAEAGFETCTPAEKREHPRRHRPHGVSVVRGCELMGLSRSTFHDSAPVPPDADGVLGAIGAICDDFESYGYRRVGAAPAGVVVDGKNLRRLMQEHDLQLKPRRRYIITAGGRVPGRGVRGC